MQIRKVTWRGYGRGLAVAFAVVLVSACDSVTGPELPDGFHACSIWGVPGPTACGTLYVPEDRASASGPSIPLSVVILQATGARTAADPVFYLTGGPGAAATMAAGRVASAYAAVRERRDIVLLDQRGTGSSALGCAPSPDIRDHFGAVFPPAIVDDCRRELADRADLTRYGTTTAAEDIDELRLALDYPMINVYGESYGTRLAAVYLRRSPEVVRSLILNGSVPVSYRSPLSNARDAQDALDALFDDCAASADCSTRYPDLRDDFASLLERFSDGPVAVRIGSPDGGYVAGELSRGDFGYAVRGILYGDQALFLPAMVAAAAVTGDLSMFATLYAQRAERVWRTISLGLYLSVLCAEDVDRIGAEEVEAHTGGTFLGDYLVEESLRACADWPRSQLPPDFHDLVATDRPVLLISGRRDPVTPPRWAEELATNMTNTLHVIFPFGGHGFTGNADPGCAVRIQERFLESLSEPGLDTSCVDAGPLPFR